MDEKTEWQVVGVASLLFMQDEKVACHDLGKVAFEHAVDCFVMSQLERATRFPVRQLHLATRFRTFHFVQTRCLISTELVITIDKIATGPMSELIEVRKTKRKILKMSLS